MFWLVVVLSILSAEAVKVFRGGDDPSQILAPSIFVAIPFIFVAACRWFTGDDEGELIAYVRRTADAKFAEDRVRE